LRSEKRRLPELTVKRNVSQIHLARQGVIKRGDAVRCEAREAGTRADPQRSGARALHHSRQHPSPQPGADGHGIATKCKINANIGNSSTSSNIDEELKKLHHAVHYGADTVMDLSTGGDIPTIRKAIIDASPVRSAPCSV